MRSRRLRPASSTGRGGSTAVGGAGGDGATSAAAGAGERTGVGAGGDPARNWLISGWYVVDRVRNAISGRRTPTNAFPPTPVSSQRFPFDPLRVASESPSASTPRLPTTT